jgi:hypothetical protein
LKRTVIIGVVIVMIGGFFLAAFLFGKGPAGPKCPLTFTEFAVTRKEGMINISGRATYANGAPFPRGPIEINLTFMMPGCGALPFLVTTDGNGRFNGDSPSKESGCILQGGTATAKTKAGCDVEGTTQGAW